MNQVAPILSYCYSTMQLWFRKYQQSGLSGLRVIVHGSGRQVAIYPSVQTKLKARLNESQDFLVMGNRYLVSLRVRRLGGLLGGL